MNKIALINGYVQGKKNTNTDLNFNPDAFAEGYKVDNTDDLLTDFDIPADKNPFGNILDTLNKDKEKLTV